MSLAARQMLVAFVAGLLFSIGLGVAGMTDPGKVLAFLDVLGGDWDPSPMFVMFGAIAIYAPAHRLLKARRAPLLDDRFHWPSMDTVDGKLLIGSVLFGIGWGLCCLCPGVAVVAVVGGSPVVVLFAAAMVTGMLTHWALVSRAHSVSSIERQTPPRNRSASTPASAAR
jgi:uncharacterized membrane protein YedE/YeeE